MNAPANIDKADAQMLDSSKLTRRNPLAVLESLDDTMRKVSAMAQQRMADRKREKSARLAAYQADKKAAKARYEAENALLDGYIAEEKESADRDIATDKLVDAKARAALAAGTQE